MSNLKERQSQRAMSGNNLQQILASEARLNRLHRIFKTQFNVTEPSLILEPYLFLGNCISAYDINCLAKLGIRYILNVAIRDVELCPYYTSDTRTFTIDLRDDDRENIIRTFDRAFAFIDEAKRSKSRVLVHCSHGQSRSPAIVIGYLMRTYNVSLEQCLTHVVKARPCVLPNDGFLKQLILYDRFLVDRRRQREEAALANIINSAPVTELPVRQHPPAAVQPVQSTAQISLPPPQACPTDDDTPNAASIPSIDSSILEPSSASSLLASTSADSIHVIPVQVPLKKILSAKTEPVPIKTLPMTNMSIVEEKRKSVDRLSRTPAATSLAKTINKSKLEVTSSNHVAPVNTRRDPFITTIIERPSHSTSRSHSAHPEHKRNSYRTAAQIQKVIPCHSANYQTSYEKPRTKYITEIYDKTTKRFIPTKC